MLLIRMWRIASIVGLLSVAVAPGTANAAPRHIDGVDASCSAALRHIDVDDPFSVPFTARARGQVTPDAKGVAECGGRPRLARRVIELANPFDPLSAPVPDATTTRVLIENNPFDK
jgi:hypothetical protein